MTRYFSLQRAGAIGCGVGPLRIAPARFLTAVFGTALLMLTVAAARATSSCSGDCDGSGDVTVDELVLMVNISLGNADLATCPVGDRDGSGDITIDEIIAAANNAAGLCPPPEPACPNRNALRNVYFGDLHVHTTNSFDAHMFDVRTTPPQAYRFARGEPASLPPLDNDGNGTTTVHIDRPLDFAAVTDHSEYLGEVETCSTPGSPTYDSPTCQQFRSGGVADVRVFGINLTGSRPKRFKDICGSDGSTCSDAAGTVWQREQEAAAAAYDRCSFTSFVAYEYSNARSASTLHRNVIFRNDRVAFPISVYEQNLPQGLWNELKQTCIDSGSGCDVLAIPHNSNESNGRMFFVEYPGAQSLGEQRTQAQLRASIEPLVEVYQHKGSSECRNGLSGIIGAADEQCEFEKRRPDPVFDCGDGVGQTGAAGGGCVSRLDYVRGALLAGLKEEIRIGANPYPLGFIGSTDTHNGTPGFTSEETFVGHRGTDDFDLKLRLGHGVLTDGGTVFSPGGLAAVWAEENSRSSIFDALRRKETFATSGTRISVRVFGGWDLPAGLCNNADMAQIGYDRGVAMGGTLPNRPTGAGAPTFVVSALRDPGSAARPGRQLQRLQVVKGWIADGAAHEQVYDIAGDADNGADVDLQTCMPRGPGADSLCQQWTDPSFDPALHAFYYVRVLENPSCRWNTYLCNSLAPADRQPACDDPTVPKTIQERAWTSPIWYRPW
ncbi:MAG: DUF3604 domain-containing protein [Deltaproteobacteria bacterium]|nr:DUF3604 domain-containing protein [Deltaproteobacteria bacterium]